MAKFFEVLKKHRNTYNIDRSFVEQLAHIHYQTITKIEKGEFSSVSAKDFLSYLRVLGFKISPGEPRVYKK